MNVTPPRPSPSQSSASLAQINTDLAMDRTLMAADRSLMAWVRTALSMISFGFTIYKILEGFREHGGGELKLNMPRDIGLFLSGLGTVAMVMGTIVLDPAQETEAAAKLPDLAAFTHHGGRDVNGRPVHFFRHCAEGDLRAEPPGPMEQPCCMIC